MFELFLLQPTTPPSKPAITRSAETLNLKTNHLEGQLNKQVTQETVDRINRYNNQLQVWINNKTRNENYSGANVSNVQLTQVPIRDALGNIWQYQPRTDITLGNDSVVYLAGDSVYQQLAGNLAWQTQETLIDSMNNNQIATITITGPNGKKIIFLPRFVVDRGYTIIVYIVIWEN